MRLHSIRQVLFAGILLATAGCHTQFSPQWSRHEIERQTGTTPEDSFEFKLDGTTMKLAKVAASRVAGEPVNVAGLSRIHLAIYELPSGGRLDFDRMRVRGWDKVIQTQEGRFGLLVLVRTKGDTLDDLVVFAQGEGRLLYGHQKGKLDPNLPSALQGVLRTTGFQGLKQHFLAAAEGNATSP
ncbi:MAG TPA: hypothetical protein PKH24_00375 [Sedimentisphaerales bacterium]|jgi:hypothetical protein|nr:hypothetical protein [Sedimentisphaerales bacterium]HNU27652.1 hypothetical protein [Sedimentisphaerales bacterium]